MKQVYFLLLTAGLLLSGLALNAQESDAEGWGEWGSSEGGSMDEWSQPPRDDGMGSDLAVNSTEVYGYVESTGTFRLEDDADKESQWGSQLRTRLKAEFEPQGEITARLELVYDYKTGITNEQVLGNYLGLDPVPGYQSGDPNDDYKGTLDVDHAYATVNLAFLDLTLGKQPIAWGSGYVFNPTDHVNTGASLEGREAETPGTVSLVPTVYISPNWALGGYVALEQRGTEGWALQGSSDAANLPYGARLRGYVGTFDVTLSFAKEVRYLGAPGGYVPDGSANYVPLENYARQRYLGFDTIGAVGDFGLYAEISLALPQDGNDVDFGEEWDVEESALATVGVEYTFSDGWSDGGLTLKAEYTHIGTGESSKSKYDPSSILAGSSITMGEDYLFLYGSQTYFNFLEVTLAALTNLNDGSVLLVPEATYSFHDNFESTLAVALPVGGDNTEYAGPVADGGVAGFDLIDPEVSLSFKASF